MKVVNPGDWARDALQISVKDDDEYQRFINDLAAKKLKIGEVATANGSQLTTHYLFIEGRQTLVYVPVSAGPGF